MKFPSLKQLWTSFFEVYVRFTAPLIYTLIAATAAFVLSYNTQDFYTASILTKLLYLGNFGLVLSLSLQLYTETHPLTKPRKLIGHSLIVLLLAIIYFALQPEVYPADIFVLLILGFAFHLLVSFSAFFSPQADIPFWQINKIFFLRFATSALYSMVLFAGLSIALLSISTLFNINWDGAIYLRLWIIIVGIFNTVFFLAGIPQPLQQLQQDTSYPKGLKIFTQYVLIPLASIYLLILLAYEIKIIFEWSLPNSSVALLILGYAVFGMLSILLVHPIRNQKENKWIKLYSKTFYLLMLPLLLLLAVAILKRISDYGITESRYLLIVLSVWLTFITGYFLIKGRDQIRMIPLSLFVFALLIVVGPWSIKPVAQRSQAHRLTEFIQQPRSAKRDEEIRNIVRHLSNNYGAKSLQQFVSVDLSAIEQQAYKNGKHLVNWELKRDIADTVLTTLKVSKIDIDQVWSKQQKNYVHQQQNIIDVDGAIKVIQIVSGIYPEGLKDMRFEVDNVEFTLSVDSMSNLVLKDDANQQVIFDVETILENLQTNKSLKADGESDYVLSVPESLFSITRSFGEKRFKLRLETLNAFYPAKNRKPNSVYYNAYLIIYPISLAP